MAQLLGDASAHDVRRGAVETPVAAQRWPVSQSPNQRLNGQSEHFVFSQRHYYFDHHRRYRDTVNDRRRESGHLSQKCFAIYLRGCNLHNDEPTE